MQTSLETTSDLRIALPEKGTTVWPWKMSEIYQTAEKKNILFHGPDFQVIQSLKFISDQGAEGELIGLKKKNWSEDWQIDIAALDGGLQFIRLWGYHMLNKFCLPSKIVEFKQWSRLTTDTLHCVINSRTVGSYRIVADVMLYKSNGQPYALLKGVDAYILN